jgi:hypothetical protein
MRRPRPRLEELDLEPPSLDRLGLPNELIEPLLRDRAVALLVDVGAMRSTRRSAVQQHAKAHRLAARGRSHHEMQIARVKPIDDGAADLSSVAAAGVTVQSPRRAH